VNADMTRLLAERFPKAIVYGIDLSPVTISLPENALFIKGNFMQLAGADPDLQPESVEYLFNRFISGGMMDWTSTLSCRIVYWLWEAGLRCKCAAVFGGSTEQQAHHSARHEHPTLEFYKDGKAISHDWPWRKFLREWCDKVGLKPDDIKRAPQFLEQAGFQNVQCQEYKMPFGKLEGHPETQAYAEYSPQTVQLIADQMPKLLPGEENREQRESLISSIYQTMAPGMYPWYSRVDLFGDKQLMFTQRTASIGLYMLSGPRSLRSNSIRSTCGRHTAKRKGFCEKTVHRTVVPTIYQWNLQRMPVM
jgi:hypothetical protein